MVGDQSVNEERIGSQIQLVLKAMIIVYID